MRIRITITDTESGHPRIETDPPIPKLVEIAHGEREKITAALAYAMKAISSVVKDSMEQGQKEGVVPEGIIRPRLPGAPGHA
jgi:hypothetical protein